MHPAAPSRLCAALVVIDRIKWSPCTETHGRHHRNAHAIASAAGVEAKGCIKGAIVGAAAGHMAGHGKLGAAAGCAIGHHEANKTDPNKANAQAPSGQK